jgi:hypothetical protein
MHFEYIRASDSGENGRRAIGVGILSIRTSSYGISGSQSIAVSIVVWCIGRTRGMNIQCAGVFENKKRE